MASANDNKLNSNRKRIHMDAVQCLNHASSLQGAAPLKNPSLLRSNFNKITRTHRRRHNSDSSQFQNVNKINDLRDNPLDLSLPSHSRGFTQASSLLNSQLDFVSTSSVSTSSTTDLDETVSKKIKKRKIDHQKNTLLSYFNPSKTIAEFKSVEKFCMEYEKQSSLANGRKPFNKNTFCALNMPGTSKSFASTFQQEQNNDQISQNFQDTYGLLGMSDFDLIKEMSEDMVENCSNKGPDYFKYLPIHVFELILCQLPILDLLLSLNRVAKYWNDAIKNEKFIPWKKKYYHLKTQQGTDKNEIEAICLSLNMSSIEDCFPVLMRYMYSNFNLFVSGDMMNLLRKHSMSREAEEYLVRRIPEYIENKVAFSWCLVSVLVLLSQTVWDVHEIIECLLCPGSCCSVSDVLECLYCIATFLLYFKNTYKINHGYHYRVFYALYLFENNWSGTAEDLVALKKNSTGQQTVRKYMFTNQKVKFTHEQMRIINHQLLPNQIVKIVAFAGTGKTSTLIEYAKLRPGLQFLNVMYNRSVCDYAKTCFPSNVECRTAHSLAWKDFGNLLRHKLRTKIRPYDVNSHIQDCKMPIHKQTYAKYILLTIENFMGTADEFITIAHVPQYVIHPGLYEPTPLSDDDKFAITNDADQFWKKMIDPSERTVHVTHDAYLKLFQLSKPVFNGYDCIFIDEAQDCSGAMLDLLLSQSCPKILVGDPNQQIYAFRGATNALGSVTSTHTYYLTQSFRFGPEISYVASCALEVLKNVHQKTLVGGSQNGFIDGTRKGQLAIIARTNNTLFCEAVRLCCFGDTRTGEPPSHSIRGSFAGGIKSYNLDQLVDLYKLFSGSGNLDEIKDRFIKRFSSFDALRQYANRTGDNDLQSKIKLVSSYRDEIPKHVAKIKEVCRYPLEMANIVFSTAHKSKGLEFDTVCLMNDFCIGGIPYFTDYSDDKLQEEFNILYVAITRAKKCLCFSEAVYFMLLGAQEKFEYIVSHKKFPKKAEIELDQCPGCHEKYTINGDLVLFRKSISLSGVSTVPGGPLCNTCAVNSSYLPRFRHPSVLAMDYNLDDLSHKTIKCFMDQSVTSIIHH